MIADSHDPIGIGGVIGGANSEIGPGTSSVLLESATFDGNNNRETAQTFGLRTEATLRFEKGLRPELAPIALRRATQLIQEVAGGSVAPGIVDVFPGQGHLPDTVRLSTARLKKVLGMDVELGTVERVFDSLGFQTCRQGPDTVEVTVPYWRNDITIEDDLVEEVVRIIGYDSVPVTMLSTPIPYQPPDTKRRLVELVKDSLAASGMQEVISYPLVSLDDLEKVEWPDTSPPPPRVANPLNTKAEFLRPTLRASMLGTLASNQGQVEGPIRLFELGRIFRSRPDELPDEPEMVSGVLTGPRWEPSWLQSSDALDFYDAKGVLEDLLERMGVTAEYEPAEDPYFRPGRCAEIVAGGVALGVMGEIHPDVAERFDLEVLPAMYFELQLDSLLQAIPREGKQFTRISRFPAATRDLALVVTDEVPAAKVREIITRHRLVEQVELFDIYTGENIPPGTKSLAFHVYFQAHDRTLTTEEVNRSLHGLLRTLEREVQASLRS